MTLRHLTIFATVCKENSITLAAKKLYISQPAVSSAIKELETYYHMPFFERISKKIYLTDVGKTVYEYALHILSLFEELGNTIKSEHNSGTIKIGSSITIGTHLMPGYIKGFADQYPNIQTQVTIDSSDIIEDMILKNELDFALIEGIVHSENIISEDFIKDELIVICNENHPLLQKVIVTIKDLADQKFLMREKNSGTRELAESILSLHNISIKPIWESTSTEAILLGVSAGLGISILPLRLAQDYLDRKLVSRLEIDCLTFERQYHIIYHKNKYLTAAAKDFIEFVK